MDAEDESQLERRAVEELLKEASRARVRAETMGPSGWMKCPLGSTNKRFLLNTLRSSALERRSGGQAPTARTGREPRSEGDKRYRSEEKERSHRTDREHGKERTHSHSERHHTSGRKTLQSRSHSPHHSDRTRSRSPARDRSALRKSRDRTQK